MQKKDVIDLIKYHAEKNDSGFRDKAYHIAQVFDKNGDTQLGEYIMAILSGENAFTPQSHSRELQFFSVIRRPATGLFLPDAIIDDLMGLITAFDKNMGIHKALFEGDPGTGKTESVSWLARMLERELLSVNFSAVIDSRLGQTAKNLVSVFDELKCLPHPERIIVLFDEIDALALDRINSNDLREMGRVTSTLLKELDELNESIVLIATTNLYDKLDKALVRRFDIAIDFDRYLNEDLVEVGVRLLKQFQERARVQITDARISKKVFESCERLPLPGELMNIVRSAVAFADKNEPADGLRRIYKSINGYQLEIATLRRQGFSIRQIGELLGMSKTKVAQSLGEVLDE